MRPVIRTIQLIEKICLMGLAHHQHRLLDRLLQRLHCCPAYVRLHIFGLSPFQISFVIWQGKILNESLLILTVATCLMVCHCRKRQEQKKQAKIVLI